MAIGGGVLSVENTNKVQSRLLHVQREYVSYLSTGFAVGNTGLICSNHFRRP
jgi:hypothetical protein